MALGRAMRSEMSLKRSQPTQFAQACHVGFLTRGAQLGETKVETKNVIFYRSIATWPKRFGLSRQPQREYSMESRTAMNVRREGGMNWKGGTIRHATSQGE